MNREAFEARLNQLLDERRPIHADEEICRLAEGDTDLRALRDAYATLMQGTSLMPRPEAPDDMASRVLTQVAVRRRTSSRWRRGAGLVASAAMLLGLTWSLTVIMSGSSREAAPIANNQPADKPETQHQPAPRIAQEIPAPPLENITRDMADSYHDLAGTTSEHVTQALSVVPRLGSDSPDAAVSMPGGLISLGRSTGGSVTSLFRAFSVADTEPNG